MTGIGGHLPFLVLLFPLAWIAGFVYWIVAIVEVAQTPGWQFKAVGSDKTAWVLIVVLLGIIGALIWLFAKRSAVKAASSCDSPAARGVVSRAGDRIAAVVGRCPLV